MSRLLGVCFPGASAEDSPPRQRYDVVRDLVLRDCTFGDRVEVAVVNGARCDLSRSAFLGSSQLLAQHNERDLTCEDARFDGDVILEAEGHTGSLLLTRSRFGAASRFNRIERVKRLSFTDCRFAQAPTFGGSPNLPPRTEFKGATFDLRAEDESAFRGIRNFFAAQRARDWEGLFYAYEKRCHRLGLRRPREWIPRSLSFLYDKASEYGYSYGRALMWFCIVQLGFLVIYAALAGELAPGGDFDGRLVAFTFAQVVKPFELFSSRVASEGAYAIVPGGADGLWLFLTALQSVLSISLIALFLLALRWRFRRE
ncbi:MAG: hypothetical protein WCB10_11240 [Steroidobacteraceae bacterium]